MFRRVTRADFSHFVFNPLLHQQIGFLGGATRRIDWRASLRRSEILVRKVESESEAEVEVRLRTRGARAGDAFERSVTEAASEAVAHLGALARVTLRTDEIVLPSASGSAQRARILSLLATVQPAPGDPAEAA